MGCKFVVNGIFRIPHKDSVGESIDNLDYDEAMEIYKNWSNRERKYKEVWYEEYQVE